MEMTSVMAAIRIITGKIPLLRTAANGANADAQRANEAADQMQSMGLSVIDGKLNVTYENNEE